MARFVLVNAIGGRRAGEILNSAQGDGQAIAGLPSLGGVLVPLPNAAMELAAERATAAYARAGGDETAMGVMLASFAEAGGGVGGGLVSWRQDGTGDVQTWAEVYALVQASSSPLSIFVSETTPYVIPPGTYDMKGSSFVATIFTAGGSTVSIADGAVLHDLATLYGSVVLVANSTSGDALTYSPGLPGNLILQRGAGIVNMGTVPAVTVLPGNQFILVRLERDLQRSAGVIPSRP